jgi:cell division transport system permease protein
LKALPPFLAHHVHALVQTFHVLCVKPFATFMTVLVVALTLSLPALLWVLTDNVNRLTQDWQHTGHISLYLKIPFPEAEEKPLLSKIQAISGVAVATFKSADKGLQEFKAQEGMQDVMQYLPNNPLPAVIDVIPAVTVDTPIKLENLVRELKAFPEVDIAKVDSEWVARLQVMLAFISKAIHAVIALLALGVVVIIGNTLRLSIHNRQEEIQVLKLIGATDSFIIRPFLYQGLCYGVASAILATLFVNIFMLNLDVGLKPLLLVYKTDYKVIGMTMRQILTLLCFAGILGWLGARVSVQRQLASIEPYR